MANWADSAPNEATAYTTVLTNLRDRDKDVAKMFSSEPTNPEESFMRYNRSLNKFQEYLSAVWTDKVISVAGGGTGGATATAARTNLGLGSMALQASTGVSITGGSISSGVAIDAAALTSGLVAQGRLGSGSGGAGLKVLHDDQTFKISVPVGVGFIWFTNSAPTGYLMCDGSAVSRTTYADLFTLWGTFFGVGDGSTTFNVPDLRQRYPLGKAASGTGSTLGGTFGSIDHVHSGPSHLHAAGTLLGPSHQHNARGSGWVGGQTSNPLALIDEVVSPDSDGNSHQTLFFTASTQLTSSAGNGSVTGSTALGGTADTGAANPPTFVVNYIVKY